MCVMSVLSLNSHSTLAPSLCPPFCHPIPPHCSSLPFLTPFSSTHPLPPSLCSLSLISPTHAQHCNAVACFLSALCVFDLIYPDDTRHCGVETSKFCLWVMLHGGCVCVRVCVCVYVCTCMCVRLCAYSKDLRFNCSLPSSPTLA